MVSAGLVLPYQAPESMLLEFDSTSAGIAKPRLVNLLRHSNLLHFTRIVQPP